MGGGSEKARSVSISFPVKCLYRGGHTALGGHGRHFWIEDGAIGYGDLKLSHSIPLNTVTSIEVTERQVGGTEAQTFFALGAAFGGRRGGRPGSAPKQITDIRVRTVDGQEPHWEVEKKGADWVHGKLASVLQVSGIPFYDELPPRARNP